MQQIQRENRLRFVFGDRLIAFGLGAGVTFGEVARAYVGFGHLTVTITHVRIGAGFGF